MLWRTPPVMVSPASRWPADRATSTPARSATTATAPSTSRRRLHDVRGRTRRDQPVVAVDRPDDRGGASGVVVLELLVVALVDVADVVLGLEVAQRGQEEVALLLERGQLVRGRARARRPGLGRCRCGPDRPGAVAVAVPALAVRPTSRSRRPRGLRRSAAGAPPSRSARARVPRAGGRAAHRPLPISGSSSTTGAAEVAVGFPARARPTSSRSAAVAWTSVPSSPSSEGGGQAGDGHDQHDDRQDPHDARDAGGRRREQDEVAVLVGQRRADLVVGLARLDALGDVEADLLGHRSVGLGDRLARSTTGSGCVLDDRREPVGVGRRLAGSG